MLPLFRFTGFVLFATPALFRAFTDDSRTSQQSIFGCFGFVSLPDHEHNIKEKFKPPIYSKTNAHVSVSTYKDKRFLSTLVSSYLNTQKVTCDILIFFFTAFCYDFVRVIFEEFLL